MHLTRHKTRLGAALVMSAVVTVMTAGPAFAHEGRDVGPYKVEVGWVNEPTYTGFPNGVALFLNDANDQPIEDLGDTLKVEVSFGEEKTGPLDIEPAFGDDFGTKGEYHADVIPTRPGKYTFHFTGTVRGQNFDESFTSSDTGFDEAKDDTEVAFPVKDPSRGRAGAEDRPHRPSPGGGPAGGGSRQAGRGRRQVDGDHRHRARRDRHHRRHRDGRRRDEATLRLNATAGPGRPGPGGGLRGRARRAHAGLRPLAPEGGRPAAGRVVDAVADGAHAHVHRDARPRACRSSTCSTPPAGRCPMGRSRWCRAGPTRCASA